MPVAVLFVPASKTRSVSEYSFVYSVYAFQRVLSDWAGEKPLSLLGSLCSGWCVGSAQTTSPSAHSFSGALIGMWVAARKSATLATMSSAKSITEQPTVAIRVLPSRAARL